jgi:ribosome biogenesis GTPase
VGKSTLINRLSGRELLRTAAVRADDDRGRHTTTHRQLVRLPNGSLLIDNPGMRELQLWGEEQDVGGAFGDIEELAENCRFSDCLHQSEPGCAVLAALDEGELDEGRYQQYLKFRKELQFLEKRRGNNVEQVQRERGKQFQKMVRQMKKVVY